MKVVKETVHAENLEIQVAGEIEKYVPVEKVFVIKQKVAEDDVTKVDETGKKQVVSEMKEHDIMVKKKETWFDISIKRNDSIKYNHIHNVETVIHKAKVNVEGTCTKHSKEEFLHSVPI